MSIPPLDLTAARLSKVDACPECVLNVEPPRAVVCLARRQDFVAFYRCTDCGHRWLTSWNEP